jgi:hypothetical protein
MSAIFVNFISKHLYSLKINALGNTKNQPNAFSNCANQF